MTHLVADATSPPLENPSGHRYGSYESISAFTRRCAQGRQSDDQPRRASDGWPLPRMASTSVKFHVEHRNSEWPMALVGRRVCLKHIARTTSFTWNTRRRRGRWNGPADRIRIARTQPVGPFNPCVREVMPKEPGVVSDRLLRPVALGPDGRERRLHEADRSEFHSAIAAAHIRRQCMEFRGSWHHLTLRRCSGGAQRVDVSRETPNSGHNL